MGKYDNLDLSTLEIQTSNKQVGDLSASVNGLRERREARRLQADSADQATTVPVLKESGKNIGRSILHTVKGILNSYDISPEQRKDLENIGVEYWKVKDHEPVAGTELLDTAIASEFLKANQDVLKDMSFVDQVVMAAPPMGVAAAISIATRKPKLGAMFMGTQIMGNQIEGLVADGVDLRTATAKGFQNALMQYPLEQFGLSKATKLWRFKTAIAKRATAILAATASEGVTEGVQVLPERVTDILAKDVDKSSLEAIWETMSDPQTYKQMGLEAAIGGIFGFAIGGVGAVKSVSLDEAAQTITEKDLTDSPAETEHEKKKLEDKIAEPELTAAEKLNEALKKGKERGKKAVKKIQKKQPKKQKKTEQAKPEVIEAPPETKTVEESKQEDLDKLTNEDIKKMSSEERAKKVYGDDATPEQIKEVAKTIDKLEVEAKTKAADKVDLPQIGKMEEMVVQNTDGTTEVIGKHSKITGVDKSTEKSRQEIKDLSAKAKKDHPGKPIGWLNKKDEFVSSERVAKELIEPKIEAKEKKKLEGQKEKLAAAKEVEKKKAEKAEKTRQEKANATPSLTKDQKVEIKKRMPGIHKQARVLSVNNPSDYDDLVQAGTEGLLQWVRKDPKIRPGFSPKFAIQNELATKRGRGMISRKGVQEGDIPKVNELAEDKLATTEELVAEKDIDSLTEQEILEAEGKSLGVKVEVDAPKATLRSIEDKMLESSGSELTGLMRLRKKFEGTIVGKQGIDTSKLTGRERDQALTELKRTRQNQIDKDKAEERKSPYTKTPSKKVKFVTPKQKVMFTPQERAAAKRKILAAQKKQKAKEKRQPKRVIKKSKIPKSTELIDIKVKEPKISKPEVTGNVVTPPRTRDIDLMERQERVVAKGLKPAKETKSRKRITIDKAVTDNAIELVRRRVVEKKLEQKELVNEAMVELKKQGYSAPEAKIVLIEYGLIEPEGSSKTAVKQPKGTPNTKKEKRVLKKKKKTLNERLAEASTKIEAKKTLIPTVQSVQSDFDSKVPNLKVDALGEKGTTVPVGMAQVTVPAISNTTIVIPVNASKAEIKKILDAKALQFKEGKDRVAKLSILNNEKGSIELDLTNASERINTVVDTTKRIIKAAKPLIDVETPWKRMDAGGVGLAVKTLASVRKVYEDESAEVAKKIVKTVKQAYPTAKGDKFKELMADVILGAEKQETFQGWSTEKQLALQPAVSSLRDYFDESLAEYEESGISGINFYKNMIAQFRSKMSKLKDINQMNSLVRKLTELEKLEFVHLPRELWFPKNTKRTVRTKAQRERAKRRTGFDLLVSKLKRRAISIHDLLEKTVEVDGEKVHVIKKRDIDPITMLLNYGQHRGKDMAIVKLRDAAIADGFVKDQKAKPQSLNTLRKQIVNMNEKIVSAKTPAAIKKIETAILKKEKQIQALSKLYKTTDSVSWEKLPTQQFSAFKDMWLDTRLIDALNNAMSMDDRQGIYEKAVSVTKMMQFYNPLFMPMYDIHQALVMGGQVLHPVKWAKSMTKAWTDVTTHSDDHKTAGMYGTFSQPFSNPIGRIVDQAKMISRTRRDNTTTDAIVSTAEAIAESVLNIKPVEFTKIFYNASWNTAWKLDAVIRQSSYNYLIQSGFGELEAAQSAAKIHADYASIPAKTRKTLNKVIFTPTFAISMVKVQTAMVNSALRTAMGFTPTSKTDQRLAWGAMTTAATLVAINMVFRGLGYEPDKWGKTWVKTVDTPSGPREIKVNFVSPINKTLKYVHWLNDYLIQPVVGGAPGRTTLIKDLGRVLSYEGTPLLRSISGLINNRKPNGDHIWFNMDSGPKAIAKGSLYMAQEIVGVLGARAGSDSFATLDPESRQALHKEINTFISINNTLGINFMVSSRKPKDQRFARDLQQLNTGLKQDLNKIFKRNLPVDYEQLINNYMDRVKKLMENYDDDE